MDAVTVDRFMSKVAVNGDSGCWEWTAFKDKDGYGFLRVKGKGWKAHRFSYELFKGPIDKGLNVCHSCDNPECVNPYHLFQGTQSDNMKDMTSKGRRTVKFDEKTVLFIRKFIKRNGKGSGTFLGRWFGVSQSAISAANVGKNWRHI